ncbi:MAG: NADH-quinone oxidoreductase subunit C [Acidocella sp.]|nr:NADH-quinone oxidoreductase subunit C [Acidocella sp.]
MVDEVVEPVVPVDEALQAVAALEGVTNVVRELGALVAHTTPEALQALCLKLRDDDRFAFAQVMDICGVDWPERPLRFEMVYNLLSVTKNARLRLIVPVAEGAAMPSVSGLWPSATWWEREIWDLFGISFDGLADHRRIVTDYGFEGHPLRKDFPLTGYLEVRYDDERKSVVYEKVKLTQEFRNFDFLSPWEAMTTLPGDEKARG